MTETPPILIPQPRYWEWQAGSFDLSEATIMLPRGASDATQFAARQLQHVVQQVCGFTIRLRPSATASQPGAQQLALIGSAPGTSMPPTADDELPGPQGYAFRITTEGVVLTAGDEAGLFYGVQTLLQLIRTQGRLLPACRCSDAPVLLHRGIMLDVSRGKVPTRAALEALADMLAQYKINQLQLYTEHTFQFPSHPRIGADCGSLTADDMLVLDEVCRARHIELVPNLQSAGHMRHILSLPEYQHLAETPWRWSITTAQDATYDFLDQLYADLLPAFSVPILNVDSDEAWDLGRGQAKAVAATEGYGRVYLQHILKLHQLAAHHGCQIMVWADVLHHYPELIAEIPADVTLLDWSYEAQDTYPTLDALAQSGRPFYVCPGTSTWNTLFPRIDNALGNIRNYVRDGVAAGAQGMLLTDWGDMGHYQPLSHSWHGYLFGAEMAWTGAKTPTETFDQAFGVLCLGDASGRAVAAVRELGRAVVQPGLAFPNRSDTVYALFEEPLTGSMVQSTPPEVLETLRTAAEAAVPAFALLPDATLRHEWMFTAHQLIYASRKVQWGQRVRATLGELAHQAEPTATAIARLDTLIAEGDQLQAALTPLASEFEQLWLRRAQRSEIKLNLDRYTAVMTRWTQALAWLRTQRDSYAASGHIDATCTTYDPGPYRILWEEGLDDLRRLVDIVGPEALPPDIRRWLERAP